MVTERRVGPDAGSLDDFAATLRATYGSSYDRLMEIKTRCDLGNLFHFNQNIPPVVAP